MPSEPRCGRARVASQRRISEAQITPTAKATARLISGLCSTWRETVPTARSPWLLSSFAISRTRSCTPCAQSPPTCVKSRMARDAWSIPERSFSMASVASRELKEIPLPPPSDRRIDLPSASCFCPHIVYPSCNVEPPTQTPEGRTRSPFKVTGPDIVAATGLGGHHEKQCQSVSRPGGAAVHQLL